MRQPVLVDSRGTRCPQPIIDVARAAQDLRAGAQLRLLADDPGAAADVAAWCRMRGHRLVSADDDGYLIEVGGQPEPSPQTGASH